MNLSIAIYLSSVTLIFIQDLNLALTVSVNGLAPDVAKPLAYVMTAKIFGGANLTTGAHAP